MKPREIESQLNNAIDQLAEVEHEKWSHWQRYLHSLARKQDDGSIVISAELAARWGRQMNTPCELLSETEKESDRDQVRKFFPVLVNILAHR